MNRKFRVALIGLILVGIPAIWTSTTATAQSANPLTITVNRIDPPNQQPFPPLSRLYEYTDFFSRSVTVHRGDLVNFQAQPFTFHIVALARDEQLARRAYPMIELDNDDAPAVGTGLPKIIFGDGNFPVTDGSVHGGGAIFRDRGKGPPVCGVVQYGQEPCVFRGGDSVEIIGPTPGWDLQQRPATLDQHVRIDAPPGRYTYFDVNHPGSRGTLTVVPDDQPTSTQAEIDAASARQLKENQRQAGAVESTLDGRTFTHGEPGRRTFLVFNGAGTPNNRVAIDRIMPSQPINAVPGDRVTFIWADPKTFHTIGFADRVEDLPSPFGFDCGGGVYQPVPNVFNVPPPPPCLEPGATEPEFIGDPGNAPSGTELRAPGQLVNSGLLVGSAYGVYPTSQSWSVTITSQTAKGSYHYFDAVHPWMTGTINVG
jgi:hypothetical protein